MTEFSETEFWKLETKPMNTLEDSEEEMSEHVALFVQICFDHTLFILH